MRLADNREREPIPSEDDMRVCVISTQTRERNPLFNTIVRTPIHPSLLFETALLTGSDTGLRGTPPFVIDIIALLSRKPQWIFHRNFAILFRLKVMVIDLLGIHWEKTGNYFYI